MPQRLSDYLKRTYGEKIYRLSLSTGCTCPNRDGSIVTSGGERLFGGCTFCSEGGSGEFAAKPAPVSIQIEEAKSRIRAKTDACKFIAYFQSFTNTYGDVSMLREMFLEAISRDDIVILSIGTRPDCIGDDVLKMLTELNSIKPVWVELGLQTIHDHIAESFHRGYSLSVFEDAYKRLKAAGITVIVHVILGLPGETKKEMLETVRYLADLHPTLDGIKLQNLQLLRGTVMYNEYLAAKNAHKSETGGRNKAGENPPFHIMDMEEYTDLIAECLSILPSQTVVHRMTGDGPRRLLALPLWSLDKKRVLNTLNRKCSDLFN